jgi:hypothetical protein
VAYVLNEGTTFFRDELDHPVASGATSGVPLGILVPSDWYRDPLKTIAACMRFGSIYPTFTAQFPCGVKFLRGLTLSQTGPIEGKKPF